MGRKNRKARFSGDTDTGLGTIKWCPACGVELEDINGVQDNLLGAWQYCPNPMCGTYMEFIPEDTQPLSATCGYHAGIPKSYNKAWYQTTGQQTQAVGRTCDHWRDPVKVGEHYITVSAWSDRPKTPDMAPYPDMGVYVADNWMRNFNGFMGVGVAIPNKYKALICDWPDFGVVELEEVQWLVLYAVDCLEKGMDVDIGCVGGHGRTGTLLACIIAYLEGCNTSKAITRVHTRHCKKAIESKSQVNLIRAFCDEPIPEKVMVKEWCLYLDEVRPEKGKYKELISRMVEA